MRRRSPGRFVRGSPWHGLDCALLAELGHDDRCRRRRRRRRRGHGRHTHCVAGTSHRQLSPTPPLPIQTSIKAPCSVRFVRRGYAQVDPNGDAGGAHRSDRERHPSVGATRHDRPRRRLYDFRATHDRRHGARGEARPLNAEHTPAGLTSPAAVIRSEARASRQRPYPTPARARLRAPKAPHRRRWTTTHLDERTVQATWTRRLRRVRPFGGCSRPCRQRTFTGAMRTIIDVAHRPSCWQIRANRPALNATVTVGATQVAFAASPAGGVWSSAPTGTSWARSSTRRCCRRRHDIRATVSTARQHLVRHRHLDPRGHRAARRPRRRRKARP